MSIAIVREGGNICRLEIRGLLRKDDLDRCQDALIADIGESGTVRLLVVLDAFEGWDSRDRWDDLSFYIKHGNQIERIALVSAPRWQNEALMFASADLRKAPVEWFSNEALDDARAWLTA
jgi:SpoIIAA-like